MLARAPQGDSPDVTLGRPNRVAIAACVSLSRSINSAYRLAMFAREFASRFQFDFGVPLVYVWIAAQSPALRLNCSLPLRRLWPVATNRMSPPAAAGKPN